jgi:transcriptional regulator with XRE-family HTH domain
MTDGRPLSKGDLWEEFATNLHGAYNAMRRAFQRSGLSQDALAVKLDADKSLVSRRLHGKENLTLKTLSFMASAFGCRLAIFFVPYEEIAAVEQIATAGNADIKQQTVSKHTDTTDTSAEPEALRMAA